MDCGCSSELAAAQPSSINAANVIAIVNNADGGLDDGRRRNAKSEDTLDTLSAQ
jgi:hypothetical protein